MTVRPGWPAVSGAATFQDIRRALAGQVAKSAAGVLRSGVLPIDTGPLILGTNSMVVNVQTCVLVLDRNGAVFLPNDGVQPVQLSSAPASGSRWSVVYAKQREAESPFSDGASGPIMDKVESTTSVTAARNLLPAGAREIGVWKIDAGTSTTLAATGATYTETIPFTAMEGGIVVLRSQAEQDAWAPHTGSVAFRDDTQTLLVRRGSTWKRVNTGSNLLATGAFSATNSVTLSGLFSSAFDTYTIEFDIDTLSTKDVLYARLVAGAADTGGNYFYELAFGNGPNVAASGVNAADKWQLTTQPGDQAQVEITLASPFRTRRTTGLVKAMSWDTSGTPVMGVTLGGLAHASSGSFDGFQISTSGSPQIAGRYRIYGHYAE